MRRGKVKSLRARAAVEEADKMGRPALCWLKRSGWERGGAVVQPYFTPRLVMRGRKDSGRRKEGGICAQLVGSLGAMLLGCVEAYLIRDLIMDGRGEKIFIRRPGCAQSAANIRSKRNNTDNGNHKRKHNFMERFTI